MSTIAQLTEQLTAARAALTAALESGEPTRPARAEVARLEAQLAAAEQAEAEAQSTQAAHEADDVEAAAIALADAEHDAVEASGAPAALAELTPGQFINTERDPLIEIAALGVAQSTVALKKAEVAYGDLVDTANKTRATLERKKAVLADVKARRAAGTATPEDALEAVGLPDDIADLERMLAIATKKAAAAAPVTERAELATAQKYLAEAAANAKLRALRSRIALAENALLQIYGELRAAEKASPQHQYRPSGEYRANPDLKTILARH